MNALPVVEAPAQVHYYFQEALKVACPFTRIYLQSVKRDSAKDPARVVFSVIGSECQWEGFEHRVLSAGLLPNGWTNFELVRAIGIKYQSESIPQEIYDGLEEIYPNHAIELTRIENSKKQVVFYISYEGDLDVKQVSKDLQSAYKKTVIVVATQR